jgi:hypothetical protein
MREGKMQIRTTKEGRKTGGMPQAGKMSFPKANLR